MMWWIALLACSTPTPALQPLAGMTVGQSCARCEAHRTQQWGAEWTVLPTLCDGQLAGVQLTSTPLPRADAEALQTRVAQEHHDRGWAVGRNVAATLSAGAMGERTELHLRQQHRQLDLRLGARPGDPVAVVVQEGKTRCTE